MTSENPPNEPASEAQDSKKEEVDISEIRVRFGKYGAGLMMVIGFAYQALNDSAQSHTSLITELGILMLAGFLLGWGFARVRF